MGHAIAFYTLSALILGFAVAVITVRNAVHSVLLLVADFIFVAALYVLMGAQFMAIVQVMVYAGGVVVLYLFVVMLVNLKRPPEQHQDKRRQTRLGLALAFAVLVELAVVAAWGALTPLPAAPGAVPLSASNVEQVGWLLYTDFLIPFEVASMLLLAAMVGAIVLARRHL